MSQLYKDVVTVQYDLALVQPSADTSNTIVQSAGKWTQKLVFLEWYSPMAIQSEVRIEFPDGQGWEYQIGEPTKPSEALDVLNVVITGRRRTA